MTLNRADFPEMTDEQWNAIVAEGDRRATQATQTAKQGLLKPDEVQAQVDAAIAAERQRIEASEAERLEMDRKRLADAEAALAAERKALKAEKKLASAGLTDETVAKLLPMFTGVGDDVFDATVDSFIATYQDTVKAKVDAEKQALLENATPPSNPSDGPVDTSTAALEQLKAGNQVGAIDLMLQEAGVVPATS